MRFPNTSGFITVLFIGVLLCSAALKLYAAQLLAWEADYVPLITRGQSWLEGGAFPAVGTLSSVAAFNMPFLVWMQLPALLISRDVRFVLVATQLSFNLLTTLIIFRLGARLFDDRAGFIAAALFTFSETGISGAYTAWAQLQLPGFVIIFAYCIYRWQREGRNWQIAATLIVATAAFMTHFSAVLLYAVIAVFGLVLRSPAPIRGALAGVAFSALMLAPYIAFEAKSDFIDLKAFFTRRSTISADALAEVAHLKPEASAKAAVTSAAEAAEAGPDPAAQPVQAAPSRLERGIAWLLSIPGQFIESLRLPFQSDLNTLRQQQPSLHNLHVALRKLLEAGFWLAIAHAIVTFVRRWRRAFLAFPAERRRPLVAWRLARGHVFDLPAGRSLYLLLIALVISAGLISVRAGPDEQPSYYSGLISLQFLICGYGVHVFRNRSRLSALLLALVLVFVSLGAADRSLRVSTHDPSLHTALNLNLYRSLNAAAEWIAEDWTDAAPLTLSYDLFPEMAPHWWIVAWHTVDEGYRIGMALDHLLAAYHGLENDNLNPAGLAANPDYIVTSAPGLSRYRAGDFERRAFGALYLLKPQP